jgi:ribosome assembly protein 1
VIDVVPPPNIAQKTRLPKIVYPELSEETTEPKNKLEADLWNCHATNESSTVAYISKMFAVMTKDIPEVKKRLKNGENLAADQEDGPSEEIKDEQLLGFARLYSGKLRRGSRVAVILPKYDSKKAPSYPRNRAYIHLIRVGALYTMMGRDLVPIEEVTAGNVFAVAGLEGVVGRSATICSPSVHGIEDDVSNTTELDSSPAKECIINLGAVNLQVGSCYYSSDY